jgi:hypothetical protein
MIGPEAMMDPEIERLQRLAEAREGLSGDTEARDGLSGDTVEGRFGPGSFGYHELLDRAFLLMDNWESFIAAHPATLLDPDRYRKAREIADAMAEFYQMVGSGDSE